MKDLIIFPGEATFEKVQQVSFSAMIGVQS
jgi:hypothetical protein